jgi:hypothetical protein
MAANNILSPSEGIKSFYVMLELLQLPEIISEIYLYVIILFSILFFIGLLLFINYRRKKQFLKRIFRKISDNDKQTYHAVRATELQTIPTLKNIQLFFNRMTNRKIEDKQLLSRLYRLENIGLVNVSVIKNNGETMQQIKTIQSDNSIIESISNRYKLFSSFFLPLSFTSLIICYYLLQLVDLIVTDDLYGFGLVFSYEWANQYWNIMALLRNTFHVGIILILISLIFTIVNFRIIKNILKILNCILFSAELTLITYLAFLLPKLDLLINQDLYNFGLQFNSSWADKYWSYIGIFYIFIILSIASILICFIFCAYARPTKRNNKKLC